MSTAWILYSRSDVGPVFYCTILILKFHSRQYCFQSSFFPLQQMQWPSLILTLVLALVLAQCTWMKFSALAERLTSLIAPEALLSAVLLSTHMQECDVKVCKSIKFDLMVMLTQGIQHFDYKCAQLCSEWQWTLYLWRCSSGGKLQSI